MSPLDLPQLAQPAAQRVEATVRVLGLRNDLVVAPGRIQRVDAHRTVAPTSGEGWRVAGGLTAGDTYRVRAYSVRATADQLARDRAPIGSRARLYTSLGLPSGAFGGVGAFGRVLLGLIGLSGRGLPKWMPDRRVGALARRLSGGARTEWGLVAGVERYLLDGRRFRYTTNVPDPGPQPLVDFLFRNRAGYCQQFAGAAALLLRIDGVPARVVSGFATGVQTGPERYLVRDLDAHEWIEVYFPGYGWVPFNPTPGAADAAIAGGIDPLLPPARATRTRGGPAVAAIFAALALAGIVVLGRRPRRPPHRLQELLERTVRRTGAPLEPSTTLSELGAQLARLGPRTAGLAAEIERTRFGASDVAPAGRPRIRLARALVGDLGPFRALLLCAAVAVPPSVWSPRATANSSLPSQRPAPGESAGLRLSSGKRPARKGAHLT